MDNEKYIGVVRKMHLGRFNDSSNKHWGTIRQERLGDFRFYKGGFASEEYLNIIRTHDLVVFISRRIDVPGTKSAAVEIKPLLAETDITFLFSNFLTNLTDKDNYAKYDSLQNILKSRIVALIKNTTDVPLITTLFERFQNYAYKHIQVKTVANENYLKLLMGIGKKFFPMHYKQLSDSIEIKLSPEIAHRLWLYNLLDTCQVDFIAGLILSSEQAPNQVVFERCSEGDKAKIFKKVFSMIENMDKANFANEKYLCGVLRNCKNFTDQNYNLISKFIEGKISNEIAHKLWLDYLIETCQLEYIATILPLATEKEKKAIFERSSNEDKKSIFLQLVFQTTEVN